MESDRTGEVADSSNDSNLGDDSKQESDKEVLWSGK